MECEVESQQTMFSTLHAENFEVKQQLQGLSDLPLPLVYLLSFLKPRKGFCQKFLYFI
jgi:hypothetical protein